MRASVVMAIMMIMIMMLSTTTRGTTLWQQEYTEQMFTGVSFLTNGGWIVSMGEWQEWPRIPTSMWIAYSNNTQSYIPIWNITRGIQPGLLSIVCCVSC